MRAEPIFDGSGVRPSPIHKNTFKRIPIYFDRASTSENNPNSQKRLIMMLSVSTYVHPEK